MKVMISPGETLEIRLSDDHGHDCDGSFKVEFEVGPSGQEFLMVRGVFPDSLLYEERHGHPFVKGD